MAKRTVEGHDDDLNPEERAYLKRGRAMFAKNTDWFEFESFAFGMRSPVFSKTRTHRKIRENPLFLALQDMWLQLAVQQGRIAPEKGPAKDASRGKARRRR
jgi:hypothetical protein